MISLSVDTQVSDAELVTVIEAALAVAPISTTVGGLSRQPFPYASSFLLEEITVDLNGVEPLHLILKHLSPRLVPEATRRAKPPFVFDPRREIEVYRRLLVPFRVGPQLFGARSDPDTETYWLLTEHIRGRELYQVGDRGCWESAARWLATLHRQFAATACADAAAAMPLIRYDRDWYARWMDRTCQFAQSSADRHAAEWLSERYGRIVDVLMSLPISIVHGEFYASNVLVAETADALNIYAVDWEMTGRGPAVLDLAALTLGEWSEDDRRAMIEAYVGASGPMRETIVATTVEAVACAQVCLAVQWAGWFGRRRPPTAHRRNWLQDAVERAEKLRL